MAINLITGYDLNTDECGEVDGPRHSQDYHRQLNSVSFTFIHLKELDRQQRLNKMYYHSDTVNDA